LAKRNVAVASRVHLGAGVVEHFHGKIDSDHVAVGRIGVKGKAGTYPYLEHTRAGTNVQPAHDFVDSPRENTSEHVIVETGQIGVNPASMG
jgi:hypothetical protein